MKQDGAYNKRPGTGVTSTVDVLLAPASSVGRVFAISSFATTAVATAVTIRNGVSAAGTAMFNMASIATIGEGASVSFPQGLAFDAGLFVDVTAGVPQVSVCFALDGRADS